MLLSLIAVAVLSQTASTTTETLVLTTATELPRNSGRGGRVAIEIQNLGPNDIFCAFTSATAVVNKARKVTASGGTWALDAKANQRIFCIAATASQVTGAATVTSELINGS